MDDKQFILSKEFSPKISSREMGRVSLILGPRLKFFGTELKDDTVLTGDKQKARNVTSP